MSLENFTAMTERLDAAVATAIAERRIVGTVVLVAYRGQVVYRRAAGLADREAGAAMTENAIFRLASITKPIVTAAAMRLFEDGRLDLHAPVTTWLPGFRPALVDGARPDISIHHLLTHTSGLGYGFLEPSDGPYHRLGVSDGLDQPGLSLEDNLARLSLAPLAFSPGDGWRYSLGLDVLGGVLEAITGKGLAECVRQLVTGPLSMTDTDFVVRDIARLAKPYADGTPEPVPMTDDISVSLFDAAATFAPSRILHPASYPSGGAGMAGTADDVLRFLEAIRTGGYPILGRGTVELMMRDHAGPQAQTQGPGWGFGYGWAVLVSPDEAGTPQAAGTLQWGGAYGHSWFIDPLRDLSVVALTNTAFEGMSGRFPVEIRNAVYGG